MDKFNLNIYVDIQDTTLQHNKNVCIIYSLYTSLCFVW